MRVVENMKIRNTKIRYMLMGAVLLFSLLLPCAATYADILLMPPFVTFKDRERMQDIMVLNTGKKTGTFRMSWVHNRQNPDGSYMAQPTPVNPAFDPQTMIVFSPKQVTLPPGERQRIRMSLRRPPDLPEGDYHGHMQLLRVSQDQGRANKAQVANGASTVLDMRVGFAIPVSVRHGTSDATVTISDPLFIPADTNPTARDKRGRLQVQLSRTGKFGTFGRLRAYWTPAGGGEEKEVGALNYVNVYPETERRSARIILKPDVQISGGKVRVVYEGDGIDKGKVFDEKTFPIGG